MLFANVLDKGDIEIILALVMGVGNYLVQRKFFDFRAKDELIDSLKKENEAKDELLRSYKEQNGRLRIHRTACKIRHEKTEQVKVDNR